MELADLKPSISQLSRDEAFAIHRQVREARLKYKTRAVKAREKKIETKQKRLKKQIDITKLNEQERAMLIKALE